MKLNRKINRALITFLIAMMGSVLADENKTTSVSKSVTVTSDGNQTIRKTIITKNGKTRITTEITDADGNTKTIDGDPNQPKEKNPEADQKGVWIGLKARKASQALKNQIGLKDDEGLVVEVVAPESPAFKAKIFVEDLLLSIDGESVGTPEKLGAVVGKKKAGDVVELVVMRRGKRDVVKVTLEDRPASQNKAKPKKAEGEANGGVMKDAFDAILSDPNVPESFKKTVREMRKRHRID